MGRYDWARQMLTDLGYEVCGFDWPGNGLSEGVRGDLPLPNEAGKLIEEVLGKLDISPCGILAHSTGAFLSIPLLANKPECFGDLEWLWLSSPLLKPSHGQGALKIAIAKGLSRLFPKLTLSTGVKSSVCYHRAPDQERTKPEGVHSRIAVRFGASLIKAEPKLNQAIENLPPNLSYLITQGASDSVCPPGYATDAFQRIPSSEKTLIFINGALHEPFFERPGLRFFNPTRSWLKIQAQKRIETTD